MVKQQASLLKATVEQGWDWMVPKGIVGRHGCATMVWDNNSKLVWLLNKATKGYFRYHVCILFEGY
jgi:hypothetical protein